MCHELTDRSGSARDKGMMIIASEDATGRFAELLRSAQEGEEIVITRAGEPVARIVPVPRRKRDFDAVSARMASRRAVCHLGGTRIRELIDEGRRF